VHAIVARLFRFGAMLIALGAIATVGYRIIEGWSWLDSLYMAVITLSTVGFKEAHPLSEEGQAFTVALIVAGSGVALYLVTMVAQLILDGQLTRAYLKERMAMRIRKKHDHVIVGGYGRFGAAVVDELLGAGREVVVVDPDPGLAPRLEELDLAYVVGSASADQCLLEAGIEGASALVAATPSDAENVLITLAAKELNPEVRVHARYGAETAARRLRRAGADQVVSPFQMGGSRTAASILRPAVVDFLEILSPQRGPQVDIEQIVVAPTSNVAGTRIDEIESAHPQLRVVALRRGTAKIQIAPSPATAIEAHDLLVVIGERAPLLELAAQAEPPAG
jgi:voltage-gated potassium channel